MSQYLEDHAFLLHARAYRETSLLLECFCRQQGRLTLLAKGAKRPRSLLKGFLVPFQLLRIQFIAPLTRLPILTEVTWSMPARRYTGKAYACATYLNELLLHLLVHLQESEKLFKCLQQAYHDIFAISQKSTTVSSPDLQPDPPTLDVPLRYFERELLSELGYGLVLTQAANTLKKIDPAQYYSLSFGSAPIPIDSRSLHFAEKATQLTKSIHLYSGESLLALAENRLASPESRRDAKRLLQGMLDHLLNGKVLKSRELLKATHYHSGVA